MNFDESRLEIRGEETKSGRAFLVPLARQCLAVFRELEKDRRSDHVFHSPVDPGRPLSDGALRPAMRRAGIGPDMVVPHGFRYTASTMLNERKFAAGEGSERFRPDAIEAQLAHVHDRDKVRATYNRAEYVDERIEFSCRRGRTGSRRSSRRPAGSRRRVRDAASDRARHGLPGKSI